MSYISYFLPPYPTSGEAKLQAAVEYLKSEGCGDETLRLLAAIAESTVWSEECYFRFLDTGYEAAIELYDIATMNTDPAVTEKDPENPRNWVGYQDYLNRKGVL